MWFCWYYKRKLSWDSTVLYTYYLDLSEWLSVIPVLNHGEGDHGQASLNNCNSTKSPWHWPAGWRMSTGQAGRQWGQASGQWRGQEDTGREQQGPNMSSPGHRQEAKIHFSRQISNSLKYLVLGNLIFLATEDEAHEDIWSLKYTGSHLYILLSREQETI